MAVRRLQGELRAYPAQLRDRGTAEEGLEALAALAAAGVPDVPELRYALLQVVGAVGSVSALAEATGKVRNAVELFGEPASRTPSQRGEGAREPREPARGAG